MRTYLGAMTKAGRIRALLAPGNMTIKEIADEIGCNPAYVRVVRNGRYGHDKKYQSKPEVRAQRLIVMRERNKWRYHNDPSYFLGKLWRQNSARNRERWLEMNRQAQARFRERQKLQNRVMT